VPGKGSFVCGVPSGPRLEQMELLEAFDKTVQTLLYLGVTKEELIVRLQQGGNENA